MIRGEPSMVELECDPSVTIASLMLNTDPLYGFSLTGVLFRLPQMLQVIVITAPGEFGGYQELFQGIFLP
jgi:hypothetical protein